MNQRDQDCVDLLLKVLDAIVQRIGKRAAYRLLIDARGALSLSRFRISCIPVVDMQGYHLDRLVCSRSFAAAVRLSSRLAGT